jgi:multisubunit Na+/H+ antiporter MnhE subunit
MGAHRRSRESARGRRRVRAWLGWWAALALVWVLLVDTFRLDELIVGALAAAIAATVATAVLRRGYIRFSPRAAWLLETPYVVRDVLVDCVLLAGALWRRTVRRERVRGVTVRVPFHHGDDSGRDGARRALVNFAVSLTPNSYVVDIDPEGDSLLVHRLVPVPLDRVLRREEQRAASSQPPPDPGVVS